MTPLRLTHLTDDELAQLADGVLSTAELHDLDTHAASCKECQQAVEEALRGLAILSRASNPPGDMAQHVRARRWALARDPSSLITGGEQDIAEVGGRGMDEPSSEEESEENSDKKE